MPNNIRLTDDEFKHLIETGDRDTVKLLNDDERNHLIGILSNEERQRRQQARGPLNEIGQLATSRRRRLKTQIKPPLDPTKPKTSQQTQAFEQALGGLKERKDSAAWPPSFVKERQQKMYGQEAGSVFPPVTKGEATALKHLSPITRPMPNRLAQATLNIPIDAYNFIAGMADMAGHAAKATTSGVAMAGTETGKSLGLLSPKEAQRIYQEWEDYGAENTNQLINMAAGVAHMAIDVPASMIQAGLGDNDTLNNLRAKLFQEGITPPKFADYVGEMPIGTALFLLPYVKLGIKMRRMMAPRQLDAEANTRFQRLKQQYEQETGMNLPDDMHRASDVIAQEIRERVSDIKGRRVGEGDVRNTLAQMMDLPPKSPEYADLFSAPTASRRKGKTMTTGMVRSADRKGSAHSIVQALDRQLITPEEAYSIYRQYKDWDAVAQHVENLARETGEPLKGLGPGSLQEVQFQGAQRMARRPGDEGGGPPPPPPSPVGVLKEGAKESKMTDAVGAMREFKQRVGEKGKKKEAVEQVAEEAPAPPTEDFQFTPGPSFESWLPPEDIPRSAKIQSETPSDVTFKYTDKTGNTQYDTVPKSQLKKGERRSSERQTESLLERAEDPSLPLEERNKLAAEAEKTFFKEVSKGTKMEDAKQTAELITTVPRLRNIRKRITDLQEALAREGEAPPPPKLRQPTSRRVRPNPIVKSAADSYRQRKGLPPYTIDYRKTKINSDLSKRMAEYHEQATHAPDDPAVRESYSALISEVNEQAAIILDDLKAGIKLVEPGQHDVYEGSAAEVIASFQRSLDGKEPFLVRSSKTDNLPPDHPLSQPTELASRFPQLEGWVNNDVLRLVHDVFGHIAEGHPFTDLGEERAWYVHATMFTDRARPALASETRLQNAVFSQTGGTFAKQKAYLPPEEFYDPFRSGAVKGPSTPTSTPPGSTGGVAGNVIKERAEKSRTALRNIRIQEPGPIQPTFDFETTKQLTPDSPLSAFSRTEINAMVDVGVAHLADGVRTQKEMGQRLVREFGPNAGYFTKYIMEKARERYQKTLTNIGASRMVSTRKLLQLMKEGMHGAEWYDRTLAELTEIYGRGDAEMLIGFLSATSAATSVAANVTRALQAFAEWKTGQPFSNKFDPHIKNLNRVIRGEQTLGGRKIHNFWRALLGDENAVVVDRWMMRIFGFKGDNPTNSQYSIIEARIRNLATEAGITPRQAQAALWIAYKKRHGRAGDLSFNFETFIRNKTRQPSLFEQEILEQQKADAGRLWTQNYDRFTDPETSPLSTTQYSIFSAENPMGKVLSADQNSARTKRLLEELRDEGYHPITVEGNYGGKPETSVIVPGMTDWDALDYALRYGQESVLTTKGILTREGTLYPSRNTEAIFSPNIPNDYTTVTIDGKQTRFQLPIDWEAPLETNLARVKTTAEADLPPATSAGGAAQRPAAGGAAGGAGGGSRGGGGGDGPTFMMGDQAAKFMGTTPDSPQAVNWRGMMGEGIRIIKDSVFATAPALRGLLKHNPRFYRAVEHLMTARMHSQVMGWMFHQDLTKVFSENGKFKHKSDMVKGRTRMFAKYLLSEKAKGLKSRNEAEVRRYHALKLQAEEINRLLDEGHEIPKSDLLTKEETEFLKRFGKVMDEGGPEDVLIPELTAAEEAAFMADPTTAEALAYWDKEVQPFFESFKEEAGITSTLETPSGRFITHIWHKDPTQIPKGTPVHIPGVGGGLWGHVRTKAKSARRAKGTAPPGYALSESLRDMLDRTLTDRITAAYKRRVQNEVFANDYSSVEHPSGGRNYRPGDKVMFGDRMEPLTVVTIEVPTAAMGAAKVGGEVRYGPTHLPVSAIVPSSVKQAYNLAIQKPLGERIPALDWWNRFVTASTIALPAEASMHGLGVWVALAQARGIGQSSKLARAVAVQGGMPGRMLAAIADMWSLEGEAFKRDMIEASRGMLRTSHFEKGLTNTDYKPNKVFSFISDLPGARHLKDFVFGAPGMGKGLHGLETRARVAMYRAVKAMDPTISNSHARHLVNNQMGTYTAKLEPLLAKALRPVDPFSRAGTALTKAGVKGLFGFDQFGKFSWELAYNNITTAAMIVMAVKMLDGMMRDTPAPRKGTDGTLTQAQPGDGRWPWEIPGLGVGDIPYYWDASGQRYDLPLRLTANTIHRGLNATGTKDMWRSYWSGDTDIQQLSIAQMHGVANQILARMGPPVRATSATLTGRAPYLLRSGELLPQETPNTLNPLLARAISSLKATFPVGGKGWEVAAESRSAHPDTTTGLIPYTLAKYLGMEPTIRPEGYEFRSIGQGERAQKRRLENVAWSIIFESANVTEDRPSFIRKALESRTKPGSERLAVAEQLIGIYDSLPDYYTNSAVRQLMYERGVDAPGVIE